MLVNYIFVLLLVINFISYNSYIFKKFVFQTSNFVNAINSHLYSNILPTSSESQKFIYDDYDSIVFDEVSDNLKYFREYTKRGITRLRNNNLYQALSDFNKAKQYNNSQPLIQRGILLYCLGQYEEAEKQFDSDILKIERLRQVKASDLRLWRSASLNKLGYTIEAKRAIDIYLNDNDIHEPRYLMNCTLDFYAARKDLVDILEIIENSNEKDLFGLKFFGNFYLGLYFDSINDYDASKTFLHYPSNSNRYPQMDMWYHIPRILYNLRFNTTNEDESHKIDVVI